MAGSKLLIHCCCAHCAAYTIEHWQSLGYKAGAFWYNPNIHPYTEHKSRLDSMKSLAKEMGVSLCIDESYDVIEYFRRVAGNEADRCRHCFEMRLAKTAVCARENGFTGFTTTLLISPHQKHELLKEIGQRIGGEEEIDFLYQDLRKRYSDSRHMTKPLNLYRQQYCGCIYSEWERYTGGRIE